MFGHHNDDDNQEPEQQAETPPESAEHTSGDGGASDLPAAPTAGAAHPEPPATDSTPPAANDKNAAWQHPGKPLADEQEQISDVISPAGGFPKRPTYQYPKGAAPPSVVSDDAASSDDPANRDLVDVKKHALEELEPLLDKLDLPPEEKFRAIMMILQAKDDKSLVKAAYEAAHAIEDDDIRAQALFTIVNEVDYFIHHDGSPN